jgi:glutamate dehydrogenase
MQTMTIAPANAVEQAALLQPAAATFINAYFRHVPVDEQPRSAGDVLAIIDGHLRMGRRRLPGGAEISVYTPAQSTPTGSGWAETATVVDVVMDDMPNLVDSVVAALTAAGHTVQRVLHPILAVCRDADGHLLGLSKDPAVTDGRTASRESWMHVLIDKVRDPARIELITTLVRAALDDVRAVQQDGKAMTAAAAAIATELRDTASPRRSGEVAEAADFVDWLVSGHLTLLGYQRRDLLGASPEPLRRTSGVGWGILRESRREADGYLVDRSTVGSQNRPPHLLLTHSSSTSALSANTPPLEVTIRILDGTGGVTREHRLVGVLTPTALNCEVTAIPLLRRTVHTVLTALGATTTDHTGQRALEVLAAYPRAELLWASPELVTDVVTTLVQLANRRRLRAFLQPDPFGRFVSVLVFLPRDRYTTDRRLAMQKILLDALHGNRIRYTARVGDSALAAVHFVVDTDPDHPVSPDLTALTTDLRGTIRTWEDRLVTAVVGGGEEDLDTAEALARYADAFDEAYQQAYDVDDAVADLAFLDRLTGPDDLALRLAPAVKGNKTSEWSLKLYVTGDRVTLSRALPVLHSLGAEVLDERPFQVRRSDHTLARIYDFSLRLAPGDLVDSPDLRARITEAFAAAWNNDSEIDGFNTLVVGAALTWRQVNVLRAYAHYLRQIGTPHTQRYIELVLEAHPHLASGLMELFAIQFDPDRYNDADNLQSGSTPQRAAAADRLRAALTTDLDSVTSLDADRILRTLLALITATTRTNHYRTDSAGAGRAFLSLKLTPSLVPNMPKPVPAREIWVSSTRVEGVHLRFGAVARGGLRWSDRPEDFRTEILGLVKAQEVKNSVIVPVGAKGGFVVRRPPTPIGDPATDRERQLAEGIDCYRMFIAALLDVTDNRVGNQIVPPTRVVRRDEDDPYLVVAADKGTATFSDTANAIAAEYGFWLGDAFASGGSQGYDHKAMGITARGGWESVKHHFRELGVDTQTQEFTCVGVGDMSGDVFGNGMLLSPHIRLVGAFDHRHIFVDPAPVAGASYRERQRLFALPRSSWADYDPGLISAGGGVWSRAAKSVPVSGEMRLALDLPAHVTALPPDAVIRAILLAPVDLLWNGGIGTYIKASTETNLDVGDKANDRVRVDGNDLRVKVIGEGGNLGLTQRGRIEFAGGGGRLNTDAIDNSAGVDTSDHEVNIKIALQPRLIGGGLTEQDRRNLLTAMTDDVADLVLANNIGQNRALGVDRHTAPAALSVHGRLIDALNASGQLDRSLEFLPAPDEIRARRNRGAGLTGPELSVLLAYVKSGLASAMLASELPDDPAFTPRLTGYFPARMRPAGREQIGVVDHPLAREIITSATVNEMVDAGGISFAFRLEEELAATGQDAIRAYTVSSAVFDLPGIWRRVSALDNTGSASCQNTLIVWARRLLDRSSRWFLTRRPQPLDVTREIERYAGPVSSLLAQLPTLLRGVEVRNVQGGSAELRSLGAPADLADDVAYGLYAFSLLNIVDVSEDTGRDLTECAAMYFAVSEHLGFLRLLTAVTGLERGSRWHALARQTLRDDLYRSLQLITADILATTTAGTDPVVAIEEWEVQNATRLSRARRTLDELSSETMMDLAALSVAGREIRSLIR